MSGLNSPSGPPGHLEENLQFRLLIENAKDFAVFSLDSSGFITTWNPGVLQVFGYTQDEWIGQPFSHIFVPEDIAGGAPERELATARQTSFSPDIRWHVKKNGDRFQADGVVAAIHDAMGNVTGFCKVVKDATAQLALARLGSTLVSIGDAVLVTDAQGKVTLLNPVAEQLTGWTHAEAQGSDSRVIFDIVNEHTRAVVDSPVERVLRDGVIVGLANHTILRRRDGSEVAIEDSGAPVFDAQGRLTGVVLVFRDVSVRRLEEQRIQTALDYSQSIVDTVREPLLILNTDLRVVSANRSFYQTFQVAEEATEGTQIYDLGNGQWNIPALRTLLEEVIPQNEIMTDFTVRHNFPALGPRVMVLNARKIYRPGNHTEHLLLAIEDVTERRRVQDERERLYQEEHMRADRDAVLAGIGRAMRSSLPPGEVQAIAVEAVGSRLGVDRAYFATIDAERDQITIARDYCTEGIPSLAGTYSYSNFAIDFEEAFGGGRTLVVPDVQNTTDVQQTRQQGTFTSKTAQVVSQMAIRALVNVPFYDEQGRLVAAFAIATAYAPRDWTSVEISLVEQVATELNDAVTTMQAQQRERNIAVQLQDALIPIAPQDLPGMRMAGFYKPALDEAGVGGDFWDSFALEPGRTCLVVSDLSGKGLEAARQTATVRNMLRYAVAAETSLAQAMARLNQTLLDQQLLAGFATLFVGVYDDRRRTLAYVNCGQEPGLIWRASTGTVEQLTATGPVLGSVSAGRYSERLVTLSPGDILALFTDGLTEVGPNRRSLLEIEGVTSLLRQCAQDPVRRQDPKVITDCLITGVDAYAEAGARDDVALFIGVVTEMQ